MPRGTISFRADKNRQETTKAEPYGEIKDGTYTLLTNKKPGAPVGKYVVLIEASEEATSSATPKQLVHSKYGDPINPILQKDVVENPQPGHYDIDIPK